MERIFAKKTLDRIDRSILLWTNKVDRGVYQTLSGRPGTRAANSYLSTTVIGNWYRQLIKLSDHIAYGDEVEFNKRQTDLGYDVIPNVVKRK